MRGRRGSRPTAAVIAERAVLAGLGGGCLLPLGAWARIVEGRLASWRLSSRTAPFAAPRRRAASTTRCRSERWSRTACDERADCRSPAGESWSREHASRPKGLVDRLHASRCERGRGAPDRDAAHRDAGRHRPQPRARCARATETHGSRSPAPRRYASSWVAQVSACYGMLIRGGRAGDGRRGA